VTRFDRIRNLLPIVFWSAVLAVPTLAPPGRDLGRQRRGPAGREGVVPIHVRLASRTSDQAVAFQVRFVPAGSVAAARVRRAGSLANLTPIFESAPQAQGSVSYIASFDERSGSIPLRSDAAGEEQLAAELELWLARDVSPGDVIELDLVPGATASATAPGPWSARSGAERSPRGRKRRRRGPRRPRPGSK